SGSLFCAVPVTPEPRICGSACKALPGGGPRSGEARGMPPGFRRSCDEALTDKAVPQELTRAYCAPRAVGTVGGKAGNVRMGLPVWALCCERVTVVQHWLTGQSADDEQNWTLG